MAAGAVVVLVAAIYLQVRTFAFVNIDDQEYVTRNLAVLRGLGWEGLLWAFGSFHAANWHPLTWLSHMADVSAFGLEPGAHHLVSVALHAANAVLLLVFLARATGAPVRSAVVAALFAVHPLHVESVAWVAERKDVLSALFFLLALNAWVSQARRPGTGRYAAVCALLVAGLLTKPMLVTFPFVLLLVDVWPLARLRHDGTPGLGARAGALALEKAPLLVLCAASSAVTWLAQSSGSATATLAAIPLGGRVENAVVAYALYLVRTVWPAGLAAFYPHPGVVGAGLPLWKVAGAAALLVALTAVAVRERSGRPWLIVGWLWFAGMLVPVIGLVQVGQQAFADRYTYLPSIGVLVAVVWGAAELLERLQAARGVRAAAAGIPVLLLAVVAFRQTETWRDSVTVHRRALEVTDRNFVAWNGLGDALADEGRPAEAIGAYRESIAIRDDNAMAWNGLGAAYGALGSPSEAIPLLERAVRLRPGYADAWYNLGTAYGGTAQHARAAQCLREAVRLRPDDARAWQNLGIASVMSRDWRGASESLEALRRLDAGRAQALRALMASAISR